MSRTIVSTNNAPKTAALYSQAVRCGSTLYVDDPYPARTSAQVAALPFGAQVEIDCIMELQ